MKMSEGFISLARFQRINLDMSSREMYALFSHSNKLETLDLDIAYMLKLAKTCGLINQDVQQTLKRKYLHSDLTKQELNFGLVLDLIRKTTYGDFLMLLRVSGHRKLAFSLESMVYECLGVVDLSPANILNGDRVGKFFFRWKQHLDNNVYPNKLQALEGMADELRLSIRNATNLSARQWAADRYVVIHVLRITLTSDKVRREDILNTMKADIPEDVDKTLTDLIYSGCMAHSHQLNGEINPGLQWLTQLQTLENISSSPFIKTMACSLKVYDGMHKLQLHMHPTEDTCRRQCINHCELGLQLCQLFDDNDCVQQKRMYMLNIVYCLLGISLTLKVDERVPEEKYRITAKEYLSIFRKDLFKGIELCRKMMYYLCMARVNEGEDIEEALEYLESAIQCTRDGTYFRDDVDNMRAYQRRLQERFTSIR